MLNEMLSRNVKLLKNIISSQETPEPKIFLLCLNFVGNTHHLKIINSISNLKEFESKEHLQRALLNSNNDIIDFTKYLILNSDGHIEFEIQSQATKKYLRLKYEKMKNLKEFIFYFSGHGTCKNNEFYFNFSKNLKESELYNLKDLIFNTKHIPHRLFIIDSCHSGIASSYGNWDSQSSTFFLCSSHQNEHSGGWIMDGSDSGGILTKTLIDPIGTFFKINFKIFFDWDNKFKMDLTQMYHRIALKMIKSLKNGQTLVNQLKGMGNNVLLIFLNYLILIHYGDELLYKQTPVSFPDLSETRHSSYWVEFEEELESKMMNKYSKL
jgi:hypothetical protein